MSSIGLPIDAKYMGDEDTIKNFKERKLTEEFQRVDRPKITDFDQVVNYAMFMNKLKGREVPVLVVGPVAKTGIVLSGGNLLVPGFTAKDLRKRHTRSFMLSSLYIPDALQKVHKIPNELKSVEAIQWAARLSIVWTGMVKSPSEVPPSDNSDA